SAPRSCDGSGATLAIEGSSTGSGASHINAPTESGPSGGETATGADAGADSQTVSGAVKSGKIASGAGVAGTLAAIVAARPGSSRPIGRCAAARAISEARAVFGRRIR